MSGASASLVMLMEGREAGQLTQEDTGRLNLAYVSEWWSAGDVTPLSVSMPLAGGPFPDDVVRPFLWGLLPDNDLVLERWGRTYQVSSRNPFALLRHVGEDCAGAVQFVARDRVPDILAGHGGIDWLSDDDMEDRLRSLRMDPTAWHATQTGQFSLAGAQAKTALYLDGESGRWGVPYGATPTTHILKPAVKGFDDHDLNEHLCLEAARGLGLPAVRSRVASFGEERAIVVERYDRRATGDERIVRIHQEDMCQALGRSPMAKYQNEGGPSPEEIVELLRREAEPAIAGAVAAATFVDALALNWLLGGTDAHAKNYSLLLSGSQVRMAPLYDVASALPYDELPLQKLKMAMKVGGEYRLMRVQVRHWARLAEAVGLDPDTVVARVRDMAARLPDELAAAASAPPVQALGSGLPERLVDVVTTWASRCRTALE